MHKSNNKYKFILILLTTGIICGCADGVSRNVCESMNLITCSDVCIDPMTSPRYCGADEVCSNYMTCSEDEFCQQGKCKKIIQNTNQTDTDNPGNSQTDTDKPDACADFTKYCKNNSVIGCKDGNITVEEFCSGLKPVCDPHTVTCISLPEAVCTDGEFKCESNIPSVCVENNWYPKPMCSKGTYCNSISGECTASTVEIDPDEKCTNDSVRCENNVPLACQNSKWSLKTKCNDDSYCNSITANCDKIETVDCTETPDDPRCPTQPEEPVVCTTDAKRCFYGKMQHCQDNTWVDEADGCESGQCANETECAPLVCHTGETQCGEDAFLQVCAENQWFDVTQCSSGLCEEGHCVETPQAQNLVLCNGEKIDPMTSDKYCGADESCEHYNDCTESDVGDLACHKGKCAIKCTTYDNPDLQSFLYYYYDKDNNNCLSPEEVEAINIKDLLSLENVFNANSHHLRFIELNEIPSDFYTQFFNNYQLDSFDLPNVTVIRERAFYLDDLPENKLCSYTSDGLRIACSGMVGTSYGNTYAKMYYEAPALKHYRFTTLSLPNVERIEADAFSSNYIGNVNVTYQTNNVAQCVHTVTRYRCVNPANYPLLPIDSVKFENLNYLGTRGLYSIIANEYIFPNLTEVGVNAISVTSLNPDAVISITSEEDILLHGDWIVLDKFNLGVPNTSRCACENFTTPTPLPTLIVNKNKAPGGTGQPTVDLDNLTWGGVQFKEIIFVE